MANPWPDEKIEALRKLVAEGYSFSIIGDRLGVTRNAALGKASRMGLCTGRGRPGAKELRRQRQSQHTHLARKGQARPSKRFDFAKKPSPKQFPKAPTLPTDVAHRSPHGPDTVAALHIPLINLEPHQCLWPYSDGPFTFCGHHKVPGTPYCKSHLIRSADPRERDRLEQLPDPNSSAPASEPAKDQHEMVS